MTSETTLNMDTINELKEILEGDVFDIYLEFKNDFSKNIINLNQASDNNDFKELIRISHTIRGTSSNIGLQKLTDLTKELENGLRENTISESDSFIKKIESAYAETITELISLKILPE